MLRLPRVLSRGVYVLVVVLFALNESAPAQVINSEWNAGSGNWNVPGNWFPSASSPDNGAPLATNTYNVQIGNRPVASWAVRYRYQMPRQ